MRGRLGLLAALLAACGAPDDGEGTGQRSQAILDGVVDDGSTAVVFVYNVERGKLCTGALIAPDLVLTARHNQWSVRRLWLSRAPGSPA